MAGSSTHWRSRSNISPIRVCPCARRCHSRCRNKAYWWRVSIRIQPGFTRPSPGSNALTQARAGNTLQGMAAASGRGGNWQNIAAANGIENPRRLAPGQFLDMAASTLKGEWCMSIVIGEFEVVNEPICRPVTAESGKSGTASERKWSHAGGNCQNRKTSCRACAQGMGRLTWAISEIQPCCRPVRRCCSPGARTRSWRRGCTRCWFTKRRKACIAARHCSTIGVHVDGGIGYLLFNRSTLDFGKSFEVRIRDTTMFAGKISAIQADFPNGAPPQIRISGRGSLAGFAHDTPHPQFQ